MNTAGNTCNINQAVTLDSGQGSWCEYLISDVSSSYDGIKMQQILTILMLLVLLGSFLLLAGLVYFSEGIIRSHSEP